MYINAKANETGSGVLYDLEIELSRYKSLKYQTVQGYNAVSDTNYMPKLQKWKFQAPLKVSYSSCVAIVFEISYQKQVFFPL